MKTTSCNVACSASGSSMALPRADERQLGSRKRCRNVAEGFNHTSALRMALSSTSQRVGRSSKRLIVGGVWTGQAACGVRIGVCEPQAAIPDTGRKRLDPIVSRMVDDLRRRPVLD